MKLKINTDVIAKLDPCEDRFDNYKHYYEHRNFTLRQFLALDNITHKDKLWVVLRLADNDTKVIFALDCSFSADAADAAYAAYAADAADAAAYAAYYAAYATAYAANATNAAKKAEQDRQIEALIYLIEGI
jgi:hypothetical protein